MASTPQYGGDGTVPDLDLGQTGSARRIAGDARYDPLVLLGREESKSVVNPIPQQAVVFEDVMGPGQRWWRWTGKLKVKTKAEVYEIEALCLQLKDGYARAAGAIGAFNGDHLRETVLKDRDGTTLSTRARIENFSYGRVWKLYNDPESYVYMVDNFTVTFRGM